MCTYPCKEVIRTYMIVIASVPAVLIAQLVNPSYLENS